MLLQCSPNECGLLNYGNFLTNQLLIKPFKREISGIRARFTRKFSFETQIDNNESVIIKLTSFQRETCGSKHS